MKIAFSANILIYIRGHSGPENFKKSRPKKLVKSIKSISLIFLNIFHENLVSKVFSFKLFPSSKIDFWPFLIEIAKKWILVEIFFS